MFLSFISREGELKYGGKAMDFNKFNLFTYSRDAIYQILKEVDLSDDDEVIVPNYICNTVIDTLYEYTKKIILYDLDDRLKFDESEIRSLVSDKTKVIFFVDYFGVEAEVSEELIDLLKRNNILILKDAAHSFLTLVKNQFTSSYEYGYLVSSIYKNLPLHAGAIGVGRFDKKHQFIDADIIKKRKIITFIKQFLCFIGISIINKNIENLSIHTEKYTCNDTNNMSDNYTVLLNSLDYQAIISKRETLALEFYNHFGDKSLFNLEKIQKSILQAYPILCTTKQDRDNILNIMRDKCIDAFTWPTFHKAAVNERLWNRIILLPLNEKVLELVKEKIQDV